ncbi:hypothetical protein DL93DRAFT_438297 [Clavulina sp. PMI_390]|nr:hypothetical protein DL93DRAFT_438297 [Clavulina sp. PMI_390]
MFDLCYTFMVMLDESKPCAYGLSQTEKVCFIGLTSIISLNKELKDSSLSSPGVAPIVLLHPPSQRSAHVSILQDQIKSLETWCNDIGSLIEELQSFQNRLRQQYAVYASALVPISALPPEILSDIFHRVEIFDRGAAYGLSQVCAHWKAVITVDSTMHLGTTTGIRFGEHLKSAISAARNTIPQPLDLKVIDRDEEWPSRLEDAAPDLHERLRTLEWLSAAHLDTFLVKPSGEERNFRALESLKIGGSLGPFGVIEAAKESARARETRKKCQGLAKNAFPVLKKIEVCGATLFIPIPIIQRLEYLSYKDFGTDHAAFRSWVSHADSMKVLSIENVIEYSGLTIFPASFSTLPCLLRLILHRPSEKLLTMLFRICACPLLEYMEITHTTTMWHQTPMQTSRFFANAPNLKELVLLWARPESIIAITAPLKNLAPHLHCLIFSTNDDRVIKPFEPLVEHVVDIANARASGEGLNPFAIQTQMNLVPALQSSLPDTYLVSELVDGSSQGGNQHTCL